MSEAREFSPSHPIRVFLLDDHEVVRRGVQDLLDAEPDIEVVGDTGTAAHALAQGPALRPDVAVLDVRIPDGDGITVCRELRSRMPRLACLILTSFDDDALLDAIMAGAAGYVLKEIKGSDLVAAVRTVASGQSMLDPATTTRLMRNLRGEEGGGGTEAEQGALSQLSPREREILVLIGRGSPTVRSADGSFCPRRRSRTTSRDCWPNSASSGVSRPRFSPRRRLPGSTTTRAGRTATPADTADQGAAVTRWTAWLRCLAGRTCPEGGFGSPGDGPPPLPARGGSARVRGRGPRRTEPVRRGRRTRRPGPC